MSGKAWLIPKLGPIRADTEDMDQSWATCSECGQAHDGDRCANCDPVEKTDALRLVPAPSADDMELDEPVIKLVREYKGPTVEDLLDRADSDFDHLPGRIHGVLEAIENGDLASADRRLEESLGCLLEGPGSEHRREFAILIPLILSMFLILVAATITLFW